ncbi:hypothetical protein D2V17_06805 [Aurantiacibacter xanthus]|uniref:Uncharacterized protein n=1 Tax=Aurantiacibacter xanthus TaxID=1784712 RepID=A0A3A1P5A4_9SPHN|nr:hypothetical protein [Aurantiacibacter xanthus]RIV88598.1 hypothetical protein D2V17_06805 [Aurantiacibacter xanthus]
MLTGILALTVFVAALSAAFAFALSRHMRETSALRRAALAAMGGAILPMLVPLLGGAAFGFGMLTVLLVAYFVLYIFVALPVAFLVSRKFEAPARPRPDIFE